MFHGVGLATRPLLQVELLSYLGMPDAWRWRVMGPGAPGDIKGQLHPPEHRREKHAYLTGKSGQWLKKYKSEIRGRGTERNPY